MGKLNENELDGISFLYPFYNKDKRKYDLRSAKDYRMNTLINKYPNEEYVYNNSDLICQNMKLLVTWKLYKEKDNHTYNNQTELMMESEIELLESIDDLNAILYALSFKDSNQELEKLNQDLRHSIVDTIRDFSDVVLEISQKTPNAFIKFMEDKKVIMNNGQQTIEIIKDNIKKKPSCIAMWVSPFPMTFIYAFSGNDSKELEWDKYNYVPSQYPNSKQALYDDSFIKYVPVPDYIEQSEHYDSYKNMVNRVKYKDVGDYDLLNNYVPRNYALRSQYNGNWTCAERKILGYIIKNEPAIKFPTIYTDKYPCRRCMPELTKFVFLPEDNAYIVRGYVKREDDGIRIKNKKIK